jgi:hypothetical protein
MRYGSEGEIFKASSPNTTSLYLYSSELGMAELVFSGKKKVEANKQNLQRISVNKKALQNKTEKRECKQTTTSSLFTVSLMNIPHQKNNDKLHRPILV